MSSIPRPNNGRRHGGRDGGLGHQGRLGQDSQGFGFNSLVESYPRQSGLSPSLIFPIPPSSSTAYPSSASSGLAQLSTVGGNTSLLPPETPVVQSARWSRGAQPVLRTEPVDFQFTAGESSTSLPEVPAMRYFHTDLPMLSAERYDDSNRSRRPTTKANPIGGPVPVERPPNPKKRGRKTEDAGRKENGEETKRTRGRPRLETKDQTPTERRRTQIRLAQRAYRNRKENAITDLQAKINDLQEVNNEINTAYKSLFEYASSQGLLAQAPQFEQQLGRLQELIKQSQEKEVSGGEHSSPDSNSDDRKQESQRTEETSTANEEISYLRPEAESTQLFAGLTVTHEPGPATQQEVLPPATNVGAVLSEPRGESYEIVTAPTLENASFGADMPFDANLWNTPQWQSTWAENPWNRLTGPRTMSFNEWAFARRLHRHAVERAVALISMPNPPPAKLTRVFGFVMLFETMDEIRARTLATLARIRNQPLNYWEYPFHRLGGSGTHFSEGGEHTPSSLSGLGSPYQSNGFGVGPFNERTTSVRDTLLGVSQYINMSGWEGTWFDSGEVETYLAQNGVVIPVAADLHIVEVPPGMFADVQTQPNKTPAMPTTPPSSASVPGGDASAGPGMSGNAPLRTMAFSGGSQPHDDMPDFPAQSDSWPGLSAHSDLGEVAQTADGEAASFAAFGDTGADIFPSSPSYVFRGSQQNTQALAPNVAPTPAARRVLLDVNEFIDGLISHASCLGRAPAFRPRDIVGSFWNAVVANV
ncbi:hypothetical protein GGS23DRAFT_329020 [Durotheca rogersii]|uniref:uncharacterized protein n=1 Tax=Durotheca rogersii TaxID=419775 RepID=UPI00221EF1E1|nr:uncharacterized protein GGS23DRAFT_329020 [Durotheca rogersii]KAI5859299.1 hypothetical protein GGS23DRAFT_329020 [Durotheca rogersii]